MAKAEDICMGWGYEEIWLGVEEGNFKARSLYSKLVRRGARFRSLHLCTNPFSPPSLCGVHTSASF
jgi:hypothetical protein